jgi:hypothetical protein
MMIAVNTKFDGFAMNIQCLFYNFLEYFRPRESSPGFKRLVVRLG